MTAIVAAEVVRRLEEAGATLLSLPSSGHSTQARMATLGLDAPEKSRVATPTPSAAAISRMDEALMWCSLIPADRYVLRRIVGARSLVSPVTGRHLFSWRRLGVVLGADHKAVQRWHAQGIDLIAAALCKPERKAA